MKKILFVAASTMLLAAGCQKTEVLNQPKGNPITLSAGMNKLTKGAAEAGTANLQTQGFKVWAYAAFTDVLNHINPGDPYDEMEGISFTYDATNDKCATTGVYYWPGKDRDLDFFALSTLKNITPTFEGQGGETLSRKMTIADYTVIPTDANDDLMVSKFVRTRQNPADPTADKGTVNLFFHHALSKTIFNVLTTTVTGTTVTVNSLTVADVKTKGKLTVEDDNTTVDDGGNTLQPDKNGVKAVKFTWDEANFASPETFTAAPAGGLPLTDEKQTIATWLVLPQDIQSLNVEVDYTILTGEVEKSFKHTFALSNDTVTNWGRNMVTTYNINISPNVIKFSADVEEWKSNKDIEHNN